MFNSKSFSVFRITISSVRLANTVFKRAMSNSELKGIFLKSVEAVQPQRLIRNKVRLRDCHLTVGGDTYVLNKPCYVVGFGKAVLGMAIEIENVLGDHLERGIVTVPTGIFKKNTRPCNSKIKYVEGAKDNLPDKNAEMGASANICELNCLRKQISILKGGGLAEVAYPCKIISLVLSDIVGDPLDFIASGPTIPNSDSAVSAVQILKKYHIYEEIPDSIKRVLQRENQFFKTVTPVLNGEYEHVKNCVIGNNRIAAGAAKEEAINYGYQSVIVSTEIDGDVKKISKIYAQLARNMVCAISDSTNKDSLKVFLGNIAMDLRAKPGFIKEVLDMDFSRNICLIFAGEPTVVVSGKGKGGRNQQLALAFSVEVNNLGIKSADISFLSCGTDGIDGPTDAAGAIGTSNLLENALRENVNSEYYLDNNDSYSFYEKYNGGNNLVKIGHTGTNVMDIHIMIIKPGRN
ncbi:hypothetical protein NQ314_015810 [Rhamnusium bicolor]|uniref:Glycerate kinase n=1 Tax=Rhamnusium bicolor TaxID=1586634 RepID=A0AAV8WY03_9CUCU|nr:hypothetical protein NQ314_015810 [Rhamnusium bicolor]